MTDAEAPHTFVFADIAGFTALTEAHGDDAAADLAVRFCEAICDLLPVGSQHVKSVGDAVLIRSEDPAAAVQLALRVVHTVGGRPEFPIVRAGAHTGPAVERHGDWFGGTVNLAARVAGAARGGEVLVTSATRTAADGLADVRWEARGRFQPRNLRSAVQIFAAEPLCATGAALPIDPVCRMAVDPTRSRRVIHDGVERHFCSQRCHDAFTREPDAYTDVRRAG